MFTSTKFTPGEGWETQTPAAAKAVLLLSEFVSIVNDRAREHDREMVEALWGIIDITYAAVAAQAVYENNLTAPADAQWDGSIPVLNEFFHTELAEFNQWADSVLAPLTAAMPPTAPHPPAHEWVQVTGLVIE